MKDHVSPTRIMMRKAIDQYEAFTSISASRSAAAYGCF